MMQWMQAFLNDSLRFPEMVVLVPSKNLNPEERYYYQKYLLSKQSYLDVIESEGKDQTDKRPKELFRCET